MKALVSTVIAVLIILHGSISHCPAQESSPKKVKLYFFWASGCPHCATEKPFLETLQNRYPHLEIEDFNIWNDQPNFDLLMAMSEAFGVEIISTPSTFVGDRIWSGFSEDIGREIEEAVSLCAAVGCPDPLRRLEEAAYVADMEEMPGKALASDQDETVPSTTISLPLVGSFETEKVSLPFLTLVLGLLDSFNPCAFFVLLFLLGMLIHVQSRKTMLLVGGIFVLFSGLIYFLFMSAWLNVFLVVGKMKYVTAFAGGIAVLLALVNIKDFFFFKKGISLSMPEKSRHRLLERMRKLIKTNRLLPVLLGTVVLAIAANSYELICTSGFPMVYTRVLTLHELPVWQYYSFIALYNVFYVLPLLLIVAVFTVTFGTRKMSEWEGRVLKLVSGMMMLMLGLVLLIRPAFLNNLWAALGVLAAAGVISTLIVFICRPHYRKES